jgi:hypothetical protein
LTIACALEVGRLAILCFPTFRLKLPCSVGVGAPVEARHALIIDCSCDLAGTTRLGPIVIFQADAFKVSFDSILLITVAWVDVFALSWNGSTCSKGKQNEDPETEHVDER